MRPLGMEAWREHWNEGLLGFGRQYYSACGVTHTSRTSKRNVRRTLKKRGRQYAAKLIREACSF